MGCGNFGSYYYIVEFYSGCTFTNLLAFEKIIILIFLEFFSLFSRSKSFKKIDLDHFAAKILKIGFRNYTVPECHVMASNSYKIRAGLPIKNQVDFKL